MSVGGGTDEGISLHRIWVAYKCISTAQLDQDRNTSGSQTHPRLPLLESEFVGQKGPNRSPRMPLCGRRGTGHLMAENAAFSANGEIEG